MSNDVLQLSHHCQRWKESSWQCICTQYGKSILGCQVGRDAAATADDDGAAGTVDADATGLLVQITVQLHFQCIVSFKVG